MWVEERKVEFLDDVDKNLSINLMAFDILQDEKICVINYYFGSVNDDKKAFGWLIFGFWGDWTLSLSRKK